jgi:hypothetical protein
MQKYTVSIYETVRREIVVEAKDEQEARIIGFEAITHDPHNPTIVTTTSGDASISVNKNYA